MFKFLFAISLIEGYNSGMVIERTLGTLRWAEAQAERRTLERKILHTSGFVQLAEYIESVSPLSKVNIFDGLVEARTKKEGQKTNIIKNSEPPYIKISGPLEINKEISTEILVQGDMSIAVICMKNTPEVVIHTTRRGQGLSGLNPVQADFNEVLPYSNDIYEHVVDVMKNVSFFGSTDPEIYNLLYDKAIELSKAR